MRNCHRKAMLLAATTFVFVAYDVTLLWRVNFSDSIFYSRIMLPSRLLLPRDTTGASFSKHDKRLMDNVLRRTAFRNKTVIITTLNQAWASKDRMLDLFMDSFRNGDGTESFLNHLLIVSLDKVSQDRCLAIHKHCFPLRTFGIDFSEEKVFMTDDYLNMMWRRIYFLGAVLELGYNFIFSDSDVLWFRDPFKHFDPRADIEIACDHFPDHHMDTPIANGGFIHVHSNNRTIELYKFWYKARIIFPHKHDQDVLNAMIFKDEFWALRVKVRLLRTNVFGSFCQMKHSIDEICTIHANCCIGLQRKISDLKLVTNDWINYLTTVPQMGKKFHWSAPLECLHSFD